MSNPYEFELSKGQHRFTKVLVEDQAVAGGAHHEYLVVSANDDNPETFAEIVFQNGPVRETGVNGIIIEDLLQICAHRLECFQAGDFACSENEMALTKIQEALHWLDHRHQE